MNKKYIFTICIGDWSGDGHGMHENIRIQSNYPVEDVREMYFKAVEKSGVDFAETFCSDYEDGVITEEQSELLPKELLSNYKELFDEGVYSMNVMDFADLFLRWIKYYNPEFEYEEIANEPTFHFYGFDKKGRHIPFLGYGLF